MKFFYNKNMSDTQFNTLVQMIAELSARVERIAENQENFITKEDAKRFATKDDLKRFATKDDLKKFATKEDLKKFATKEDLKRFATKEDLKRLATKKDLSDMTHLILNTTGAPFAKLEKQVQRHEKILKGLKLAT